MLLRKVVWKRGKTEKNYSQIFTVCSVCNFVNKFIVDVIKLIIHYSFIVIIINVIMKVANGTPYWILTFHINDVFSMLSVVVIQNQRSFNPSCFPLSTSSCFPCSKYPLVPKYNTSLCVLLRQDNSSTQCQAMTIL